MSCAGICPLGNKLIGDIGMFYTQNYVSDTHNITFGTCDVVSDIRNPTGSLDSPGTRLGLYLIHGSNEANLESRPKSSMMALKTDAC